MANDPRNIRLGPCRVRWNGVDLGLTKGGVEVEVTTQTKEVTVDQFGDTPVNEYITGRKLMVKAPFAETDLDMLHTLMSNVGSSLVDDGVKASGSITLSGNLTANDSVTVNGVVFTVKASPTALTEFKLGATAAATTLNLLDMLQASTNAAVKVASFALDASNSSKINVTYNQTGTGGNAFTLAKSGTNLAVSGATLANGAASTRRRAEVTNAVGISMLNNAKELVLRPQEKADNDFSEDFVIPLAATSGQLQFAYKLDTERLFNLTFTGYPNAATGLLFVYGDKRST